MAKHKVGMIFQAVAAATMAMALVGTAQGQENVEDRTGKLHQDCNQFSGSASGDKYELKASNMS